MGTLQQCVDGSNPGDFIEIATDTPTGSVTIDHSLTLRAATGSDPTVTGHIIVNIGSGTALVVLRDLTVTGEVDVSLTGGANHHIIVQRLDVTEDDIDALHLDSDVPATIDVMDTSVRQTGTTADVIGLVAHHASELVNLRLTGNRVSGAGNPVSGTGIQLDINNTGSTRADIYNNAVHDVARAGGDFASSLWINAEGTMSTEANVVGNTFERSGGKGMTARTFFGASGSLSVDAFDNVFSHATDAGLRLVSAVHPEFLTFKAGYNDFFANGLPNALQGHSLGAGNLAVAPGFVDEAAGNLRLKATSPLIDQGKVCTVGGLANLDAAAHGRLAGVSSDMGAFERGAGTPTGLALVGTSGGDGLVGTDGADIICGLAGVDTLRGGLGGDYIDGGTGGDIIFGGKGPDRLFGNAGDDQLCAQDGVSGNDEIVGGSGDDGYRADAGDTRLQVEHPGDCAPP